MPSQLESRAGRKLLTALRSATAHLPEVTESIDGFGHTTFKVRRKSFLIAGMESGGPSISLKSDPVSQSLLVRRGPFYRTPYIGQHGWISINDPLDHDWPEVQDLIEDAYRNAAPKSLTRRLIFPQSPGGIET